MISLYVKSVASPNGTAKDLFFTSIISMEIIATILVII